MEERFEVIPKIDNLRSLAILIAGERNCDIRKIFIQGFNMMAKDIATYYDPQEPVTHLEEIEAEKPAPKKRGRKPKVKEPESEPETSPLDPEPEPIPEPDLDDLEFHSGDESGDVNNHQLVFDDDCLVKDFPRVTNIHTVTDEWIASSETSPVVLANSCTMQGEHPFYKGAPSFIWYLAPARRIIYMAGLFDFYPNILDLIDAARLDQCNHAGGPDMEFVQSPINPETRMPYELVPYEDEQIVINRLRNGGAAKFIEELGEGSENGKAILRFMSRMGFHTYLEEDLDTIVRRHTDDVERNPDVGF